MENLKNALKDKNKLLMLIPILLGILFVIVFFGKKGSTKGTMPQTEENQAFLEPDAKGEKKIADKVDAYKKEQEEAFRKKRELENSRVKGSDFYFEMQESEDEYNARERERIEKMKQNPLEMATQEYEDGEERPSKSFSTKMRQQLNDIEDQETFDRIVREAKKEERLRKIFSEADRSGEEMLGKYQSITSDEPQTDPSSAVFPEVNSDTLSDATVTGRDPRPSFIVENGKRRRRPEYTTEQKVNLIKAAIYGDQTVVSGSPVRMRLLEPLWVGGVQIPANTIFYGNASVGSSRLKITVENIRYGKYMTPVAFTIYDSDAIEGLNLPNNMKAEAARKMEQGLLQGVQLPISSIGTVTSEVTSAITATTQVARQILNQSLSQVKVHLKANYAMYIKEETKEDRKKREQEEAEIERLYKEMQLQRNEPVKKNPLTKLIETL